MAWRGRQGGGAIRRIAGHKEQAGRQVPLPVRDDAHPVQLFDSGVVGIDRRRPLVECKGLFATAQAFQCLAEVVEAVGGFRVEFDGGAKMVGGDAVSSATLVRLYAAHGFVLPALLALLVTLLVRDSGTWRRAVAWAPALAVVLLACALARPPALGEAPDLVAGGDAGARPEWFFLWINALLRATGGNRTHAARLLRISQRALLYKIKDYGIRD